MNHNGNNPEERSQGCLGENRKTTGINFLIIVDDNVVSVAMVPCTDISMGHLCFVL